MLARVLSSAVFGIDAYVVEVEVDIAQGLPTLKDIEQIKQAWQKHEKS
jgi:magnesium chelatase family protein